MSDPITTARERLLEAQNRTAAARAAYEAARVAEAEARAAVDALTTPAAASQPALVPANVPTSIRLRGDGTSLSVQAIRLLGDDTSHRDGTVLIVVANDALASHGVDAVTMRHARALVTEGRAEWLGAAPADEAAEAPR
jgi:hypothetical protein